MESRFMYLPGAPFSEIELVIDDWFLVICD
jgi:hypothetical protein